MGNGLSLGVLDEFSSGGNITSECFEDSGDNKNFLAAYVIQDRKNSNM